MSILDSFNEFVVDYIGTDSSKLKEFMHGLKKQ
jgi:hypothetical protein